MSSSSAATSAGRRTLSSARASAVSSASSTSSSSSASSPSLPSRSTSIPIPNPNKNPNPTPIPTSSDHKRSADGGFRRWSRNLSAQRQRELDRLNQIERRRQLVELKRQNDLFEQMSAAAGQSQPNDVEPNGKDEPNEGGHCLPASSAPSQPLASNELVRKAGQPPKGEPAERAQAGPTSSRMSTSSALSQRSDQGEAGQLETSIEPLTGFNGRASESITQADDQLGGPRGERVNHSQVNRPPAHDNSRPSINVKPTITGEQLEAFVSAPLPAIVDIDELSSNQSHLSGQQQLRRSNEDLSLLDDDFGRQNSAENSFSASSSISADMLLIGTNSAAAETAPAGQVNPNQPPGGAKTSGNSYSDNEVFADDSETEDGDEDFRPLPAASIRTKPTARDLEGPQVEVNEVGDELGAAISPGERVRCPALGQRPGKGLQGRDSPLVFPNMSSAKADEQQTGAADGCASATDQSLHDESEDKQLQVEVLQQLANLRPSRVGDCIERLFDNEQNPFTGTYGVLLAGRRRKKAKTYLIGPSEYGYSRKNCICKLKSNVLGTQFNAIRLNEAGINNNNNNNNTNNRSNMAAISYETNVLGFKGPRKMRVFLAKDPQANGMRNLPETFKRNPTAIVQLKNMTPSWNIESQSYVLNFHGRVTQASVKNFQLIECEDQLTSENQLRQPTRPAGQQLGSRGAAGRDHDSSMLVPPSSSSSSSSPQTFTSQQTDWQLTNTANLQAQADVQDTLTGHDFDDQSVDDVRAGLASSSSNSNFKSSLLDPSNDGRDKGNSLPTNGGRNLTYNGSIVMQFGRISNHEFTCDVAYPLSILQAFSIALSSFDSKLACE